MGREPAFLVALAAFLLTTALTIFTLFFAVGLTIVKANLYQLGLAAAVLDVADLAGLAYYFLSRPDKPHTRARTAQILTVSVLFIISHALSVALLTWLQTRPAEAVGTPFGSQIHAFIFASWGLWGASLLAQAILILLWALQKHPRVEEQTPVSRYALTRISDSWSPPSPRLLRVDPSPYCSQSISSSLIDSNIFGETKGSPRSPNMSSPGPITSRTRLALSPKSSDSELVNVSSGVGAFSDPGTGPIASPGLGIATGQRAERPTTPLKQRLEPIPGSQPNSPGKPLEGPFPQQSGAGVEGASESASSPYAQASASHETERGRNQSRVPPRFRKSSASSHSQPSSPVVNESHIHPLFRTDSPLPPPTPTVGSTITASAFGGQLIASASVSRANSRSAPHSPRSPSPSTSRRRSGSQGPLSSKSVNARPAIKRAKSMGAVKPKTTAVPQDVENMPPIPDDSTPRLSSSSGNSSRDDLDQVERRPGIAL